MELLIIIYMVFTAGVCGSVFYRMRGGWPSWPRPTEQALFCSIFLFTLCLLGVPFWATAAAFCLAVLATLTGHGQYFLDGAKKAISPESLDRILNPIFGKDPRTATKYSLWRGYEPGIIASAQNEKYKDAMIKLEIELNQYGRSKLFKRNLAGLALTGGAITLMPGIMLIFNGQFLPGIAIAFSGFLSKPLNYYISHKLGFGTEGGEYGFGKGVWIVCALFIALFILGRV